MPMTAIIARPLLQRSLARFVLACFLVAALGGFFSAMALPGNDAGKPAFPVAAAAGDDVLVSAPNFKIEKKACCKNLTCEQMHACAWHDVSAPSLLGRRLALPAPAGSGGRIPPQLGPPRQRIA